MGLVTVGCFDYGCCVGLVMVGCFDCGCCVWSVWLGILAVGLVLLGIIGCLSIWNHIDYKLT